jgi:hypothetical protein
LDWTIHQVRIIYDTYGGKGKNKIVIFILIHVHINIIALIILDYTPAFSCLAFAKKSHTDIFGSSIPDARCHLAKCLQSLTASHPNQVR